MTSSAFIRSIGALALVAGAASCFSLPPNWLEQAFSRSTPMTGFAHWFADTTADLDGDGLQDFLIHHRLDEIRFELLAVSGSMGRPIARLELAGRFKFDAVPDVDGDHGAELLLLEDEHNGSAARALVVSGAHARVLFETTNAEEIEVLEAARLGGGRSAGIEPLRLGNFDTARNQRWTLLLGDRAPATFALLSPAEVPRRIVEWPGLDVLHAIGDFDGDFALDWAAYRSNSRELSIVSPEKGSILATWKLTPDEPAVISGAVHTIDDRDSDGEPDYVLSVSAFAGPDAVQHTSYFGLATVISSHTGRPVAGFERDSFLARLPANLPTLTIVGSCR